MRNKQFFSPLWKAGESSKTSGVMVTTVTIKVQENPECSWQKQWVHRKPACRSRLFLIPSTINKYRRLRRFLSSSQINLWDMWWWCQLIIKLFNLIIKASQSREQLEDARCMRSERAKPLRRVQMFVRWDPSQLLRRVHMFVRTEQSQFLWRVHVFVRSKPPQPLVRVQVAVRSEPYLLLVRVHVFMRQCLLSL